MKNPWDRPDDFRPAEVQVGAGISRTCYNQWLFRDLISAEFPADGPGTYSRFTFKDVCITAFIKTLKDLDIRLKKCSILAHMVADKVQKMDADASNWPVLYLYLGIDGWVVEEKIHQRGGAIRLDVNVILSNVCGRIEEMG